MSWPAGGVAAVPEPLYHSAPAYSVSHGDLAAELAVQVGLPMDADQQAILRDIFAEKSDGIPAAASVAIIAPRQGLGKTTILEIAALTDIFLLDRDRLLWSAQAFSTARRSFEHLVQLIDRVPDFRRRCLPPRATSGQEAIRLRSGAQISFHARSKGSTRGMSASTVVLDESLFCTDAEMGALLPTLATRPASQVRYASSAGLASSSVLRGVRDRGRRGDDPGLSYWEFGSPPAPCAWPDCPHLPAGEIPGCSLDDVEAWRRANPSLGVRISEEALARFRREMPPREFAREFLSHWEEALPVNAKVIDSAMWAAAERPDTAELGDAAFGVTTEYDVDRTTTIGVAARRGDGLVQVDVVRSAKGTDWAPGYLAGLVTRHKPVAVMLDGSAAGLELPLSELDIPSTITSSRDRARAASQLFDALQAGRLVHVGDPTLTAAALSAYRKPLSDGWLWQGTVAPLEAATLAFLGLISHQPKPPPPLPLFGKRAADDDGWGTPTEVNVMAVEF